jgi:hypothetical protein
MQKTAPPSAKTEGVITVSDLAYQAQGWLLDGEIRQWSPRTLDCGRRLIEKLLWFLGERKLTQCGLPELRAFLAYITRGHADARYQPDVARTPTLVVGAMGASDPAKAATSLPARKLRVGARPARYRRTKPYSRLWPLNPEPWARSSEHS